ncbi:hypothetical protein BT63DRAFT_304286 [Microthyrium microscopicum]|uniref:Uncharacterized protein n=1 Tax=Microthyrium microscopicum TaxID=703497 RepID=A0A6A6UAG4_9PEZI|nr:hypothetical protein BT63DRAFT_304286 [Microthyrium microscopicum]
MAPLPAKAIAKRKTMAKAVLEEAIQELGPSERPPGSMDDFKQVLRTAAIDSGLDSNFYDCVPDAVFSDILVVAAFSRREPSRPALVKAPGDLITPPSSDPACSVRDEHRDSDGGSAVSSSENPPVPTFKDEEEPFNVAFFNPSTSKFFLLKARRCIEASSFISSKAVKKQKLSPDPDLQGRVRLDWTIPPEKKGKQQSTRFMIIDDSRMECDCAMGTGCDDDDDDDEDDDSSTAGNAEGSGDQTDLETADRSYPPSDEYDLEDIPQTQDTLSVAHRNQLSTQLSHDGLSPSLRRDITLALMDAHTAAGLGVREQRQQHQFPGATYVPPRVPTPPPSTTRRLRVNNQKLPREKRS